MKKVFLLVFLFLPAQAYAQLQAPFGRPDIPISGRDRVYAADQTSNTVSVIDPSRNELLRCDKTWQSGARLSQSALHGPTPGTWYGVLSLQKPLPWYRWPRIR